MPKYGFSDIDQVITFFEGLEYINNGKVKDAGKELFDLLKQAPKMATLAHSVKQYMEEMQEYSGEVAAIEAQEKSNSEHERELEWSA